MDNQINNQEPVSQEPINQEPIINQEPPILEQAPEPETPTEPESSAPEIPESEPETSLPSNEYQPVLDQYAANTESVNTEPAETPVVESSPRSTEDQLQDLGISSPPKTSNSLFKVLFIIALVIYILVLASLAFTYFKSQKNSSTINDLSSKTSPTPTISSGTCLLNEKTYQIRESFTAADGCNTCTCESQNVISCTDKTCTVTPTPTVTKTATKSATTVPTKTITP